MLCKRLALLLPLLCVACGSREAVFYWGDYEAMLYAKYHAAEGLSPEQQIEVLVLDIEKAQSSGKKLGPGINLHLAMLYAQSGNAEAARRYIEAEKVLYPMSAEFANVVFRAILRKEDEI